MSMETTNDIQQQSGQIDRHKAPVASNQPRENLVRLYEFTKYFKILFYYYCCVFSF
jgi:hypothetical protein